MNANRTCYIVGAGEFAKSIFLPNDNDCIICADGGYNHLSSLNYKIEHYVGDNDSITCSLPEDIIRHEYPSEKDDTDLGLALQLGMHLGFRTFHIFGGYGDRPDHFLANLQLLTKYAKKGYEVTLIDERFTVFALYNKSIQFKHSSKNKIISVFSLDSLPSCVSISGLKYNLNNHIIDNSFPLGVSNESKGLPFTISVKKGSIIIFSYDQAANHNYIFTENEKEFL